MRLEDVLAAVLMVLAGLGAVAGAQDVKVNWREKAAFGDFRTFQIVALSGQSTNDPPSRG